MGSGRLWFTAAAFLLDLSTIVSLFLAANRPFSNRLVDLVLLGGRVLGGSLLSTVAIRLALGHWPWSASNGHALAEVQRELTRAISGEMDGARQAPLLASSTASSASGDAMAQRLDEAVSSRQQELKKLERGQGFSKAVTFFIYIFFAVCSLRTAIEVVSLPTADFWSSFWVVVQVCGLPIMQLEFILLKGLIQSSTAGDSVTLKGVHEHPLYWTDVEGKGFVRCSLCNEKVGELTGGYLTLQCRTCTANRYGFGGFNVCTACYRKNAVKSGAAGEASGSGILRGDKGPKYAQPMTVIQYMKRLSGLVRKSTLAVVLICVCGSQFFSAYIPKAQGDTISALTKQNDAEFNERILEFALLVVANAIMSCSMSIAIQSLQTRMSANMSVRLFDSLLKQDIAFYDNAMTGQMNSRLNNDMRQALSPVSIIMNAFVANIVMLLVGFGICLQSSWRLTVLAFTVLTPVVHISAEFSQWASKLMMSQFTYMADAQGSATQALTNIRTVRMFGARTLELEKYEGHIRKSRDVGLQSAWGQGAAGLLSALVQQGASFIILFYGGHLALQQEFEVGAIITFTYLWNRLSGAFTSLNENINQPVKAVSAGQRVFEILDLQPDIPEDEGDPFPEESKQVGIRFENVEYSYLSRPDKKVLAGVTLDIRAGKTTAVVGKSGCGKSTLSKLVLRFYDPQGGAVYLNATELQRMHLLQYRNKVGVVSQDTQLFRMTVTENITYGLRATEYTMEDVERAARLANADEFIRALPEGYSTMVGESGHDLSGGQKQRLSIARALVRRPRILLLDEATSALDAENEALVQAALDSLMHQMQGTCTIMVIAHRLSTIKDADRIIVLHEGLVVEQGTHEELLQIKEGRYATMIARQLQGAGADGAADGEEETKEKKVDDAISEIMAILDAVKEDKRKDVLMGIMKKAKGAGKG
ncbi:Abcb10 [Symbiodinium natans]|uniref:Abcb10 protein n=1 Tax=Symbiodinium natans TaxID=878477 RepID=A0A812HWN8_9DINO|nr:Abcb10 [Symbiodinium natans]